MDHLNKVVCSFCSGTGHYPSNCASKKNVDFLMRDTGNGSSWANYKNEKKAIKYKAARQSKHEYIRSKKK